MVDYKNELPFIHLLKSRYGYYFYDVNMNEIINISEDTYKYFLKLTNNDKDYDNLYTSNVKNEKEKLEEMGYLKTKHPSIIEIPGMDNIEYYLSHKLQFLVLQVTQKCNFRCKYCHFSSDEIGYHDHNLISMDWDLAKKSIDFFAARTRDKTDISIVFYGGEPLLEYELIHRCIEYCNDMFEGKILNYFITTNAGLLTVEILKYLIDNKVNLTISLDGPQEIHDKNRKHAKDGSGTFNEVYENLSKIKKEVPDYYKKINFNSVTDPANDCNKINEFFSSDMFKDSIVATNLPSPIDKKRLYFSKEYLKNNKKDNLLFLLARANIYNESQITPIARNYFSDFFKFESRFKPVGELSDKSGHAGPCKPGSNKLFISVGGNFLICEKARDDSNALCIGSLKEGFNIQKIKDICNFMSREKCKNCWNIRNCNICQMKIDDGEKLSAELFDIECKNSCRKTEDDFKNLIAISEIKDIIKT